MNPFTCTTGIKCRHLSRIQQSEGTIDTSFGRNSLMTRSPSQVRTSVLSNQTHSFELEVVEELQV